MVNFIDKIDKLALPNQMISALDDQLLQTYCLVRPTNDWTQRMDRWLSLFFDEQLHVLEDAGATTTSLWEVLEKSLGYIHRIKVFVLILKLRDEGSNFTGLA